MIGLLRCLRFLFALSWATDRGRLLRGGGLLLLGNLALPFISLGLKHLVDAAVGGDGGAAAGWAAFVAAWLVCDLMLAHFAHLYYFELGELNGLRLNQALLRIVNESGGLELIDGDGFADTVELLREDISAMRQNVQYALELVGLTAQSVVTAVILGFVQPWLLLLPLAAVVPVVLGSWSQRIVERGRERAAPFHRRIRHLRTLASDPASQKEIRVSGAAGYLVERQAELHREVARTVNRAQVASAGVRSLGQLFFACAYVASVIWVIVLASRSAATVGDVVLVVSLATQTSTQVANLLDLLRHLYAAAAGTGRFLDLRARAREQTAEPESPAPEGGITLEDVTFRYPGSRTAVLDGVSLRLPAGTSVALVGENGAGKSTLIKLLTGLYRPATGRILVDPSARDGGTGVLFQDFARLEFALRESVGVGHLPDLHSDPAVRAAIARARAGTLLDHVGDDLDTLLGHRYGDGRDLSGGQWQNVGLSRTLMRAEPRLLCLDEPGSALDPFAEQQLYEAYQAIAAEIAVRTGGVTVYVTHRLSTVTLADLVVVLEQGRIVEQGTHAELLEIGGRYATLFALQARTYA